MQNEVKPRFSRDELILLAVLFSASVIWATGVQMGSALFPSVSRLMGVPVGTATLLTSVWALTGFLSPFFGPPSDRYGHGVFALVGLGFFTVGNLLSAIAPSFLTLAACQVLVGLGSAVFSFSVSAVVGDVFAYETRARVMGIVRFAVSVAALLGVPAAAAIAERATAHGSFGTIGGLSLIMFVAALALFPRLSGKAVRDQPTEVEAHPWQRVVSIARQRSVMISLLAIMVWAALPTGLFIYLAAWLEQTFHLTETQIGLAFSMVGVGALIGNLLTATWTDRLGKKRAAVLGLLVLSVAIMLLPRSPILVAAIIGLIVSIAALEFGFASFSTLMTELTPTGRGTLMSLVGLANGLGTGVVPLVMRPLWESGGYAAVMFVLGLIGLCMALIIGLLVVEQSVKSDPKPKVQMHVN